MLGLPMGTYIKNNFGLVILYSTGAGTMICSILYVFFIVRESGRLKETSSAEEDKHEENKLQIDCITTPKKDLCMYFWRLVTVGIKTILKKRADGSRRWIICFVLVFTLSK